MNEARLTMLGPGDTKEDHNELWSSKRIHPKPVHCDSFFTKSLKSILAIPQYEATGHKQKQRRVKNKLNDEINRKEDKTTFAFHNEFTRHSLKKRKVENVYSYETFPGSKRTDLRKSHYASVRGRNFIIPTYNDETESQHEKCLPISFSNEKMEISNLTSHSTQRPFYDKKADFEISYYSREAARSETLMQPILRHEPPARQSRCGNYPDQKMLHAMKAQPQEGSLNSKPSETNTTFYYPPSSQIEPAMDGQVGRSHNRMSSTFFTASSKRKIAAAVKKLIRQHENNRCLQQIISCDLSIKNQQEEQATFVNEASLFQPSQQPSSLWNLCERSPSGTEKREDMVTFITKDIMKQQFPNLVSLNVNENGQGLHFPFYMTSPNRPERHLEPIVSSLSQNLGLPPINQYQLIQKLSMHQYQQTTSKLQPTLQSPSSHDLQTERFEMQPSHQPKMQPQFHPSGQLQSELHAYRQKTQQLTSPDGALVRVEDPRNNHEADNQEKKDMAPKPIKESETCRKLKFSVENMLGEDVCSRLHPTQPTEGELCSIKHL